MLSNLNEINLWIRKNKQTAWIIKSSILNTKLCEPVLLMWITSSALKCSCQRATEETFHCETYSCPREVCIRFKQGACLWLPKIKKKHMFSNAERNSERKGAKKAWHFKNDENKSITFGSRKEAYTIISDYFRKLTWTNKERERVRGCAISG